MPKSNFGVSRGGSAAERAILGNMAGNAPRFINQDRTDAQLAADIDRRMAERLISMGKNDASLPDFDYARGIADLMQMYDLPMPKPAGRGGLYTLDQYNQIYDEYPATNRMMSPAQELAAREAFARKLDAMQQTQPRGLPPMFGARRILNDNALSRLLGYD
jgi:hypothetical protein